MNQADFLQHLVDQLTVANIPFMVSGSVASGYHGEPLDQLQHQWLVDAGPCLEIKRVERAGIRVSLSQLLKRMGD